jgi:hypothetical protein
VDENVTYEQAVGMQIENLILDALSILAIVICYLLNFDLIADLEDGQPVPVFNCVPKRCAQVEEQ